MWHVNSFGMVSGIVGYKTHKFSNLLYLWLSVEFYSILFYIMYNKIKKPIFKENFIGHLFPVIFNKYWYFSSYFGIYPFLPFINSGISLLSQIEVKKSMYFMIGIFLIWAYYYQDPFSLQNGYSPISLLIYYIFGAYFGKYVLIKKLKTIKKIIICMICSFLFIVISIICYQVNILNYYSKIYPRIRKLLRVGINSVPMTLQLFAIVMFVAQLKFDKYLTYLCIFIGPLTFDVYLIHENTFVRAIYIRNLFNKKSKRLLLNQIIILCFKRTIYIFTFCIFISYFKNLIFRILKIKNICIFLESRATKIINYLI